MVRQGLHCETLLLGRASYLESITKRQASAVEILKIIGDLFNQLELQGSVDANDKTPAQWNIEPRAEFKSCGPTRAQPLYIG